MIRGDASDWIDCFRGAATPQAERLDALPGSELQIIGDLTMTEVLQGFGSQRDFAQARTLLTGLDAFDIGGQDIAIQAARNDRALHERGITIRKSINALIATPCIESDYALLYSDCDFDPFVTHLGLSSATS
ncbi:MAG: type II toxin-antitoxin system VapC family toxin [Pseudomonadota bacterium]